MVANKDQILEAVKKHVVEQQPLRTVARQYEIPRNSLRRYAKRCSAIDGFFNKSHAEMLQIITDATTRHGTQVSIFSGLGSNWKRSIYVMKVNFY